MTADAIGALGGAGLGPWGAAGGALLGSIYDLQSDPLIVNPGNSGNENHWVVTNSNNKFDYIGTIHNQYMDILLTDFKSYDEIFLEAFKQRFGALNDETKKINYDELSNTIIKISNSNSSNEIAANYINSQLDNKNLKNEFIELFNKVEKVENAAELIDVIIMYENRIILREDLSKSDELKLSAFFTVYRNSGNYWYHQLK
jgi:hypothetical protein